MTEPSSNHDTTLLKSFFLNRFFTFLLLLTALPLVFFRFNSTTNILIAIGGILMVPLVSWIGRICIDARSTPEGVARVISIVHVSLLATIVVSIVKAVQVVRYHPDNLIPLPSEIGLVLSIITGLLVILTMGDLLVSGLGAPGAVIALTKKLAVIRMYAWTRNPMVLNWFLFLFSIGLAMRSLLFILWLVLLVGPAMIAFLKVFEERELELRFGSSYLEYKAKTPMIWPRKPKP